MFIRNLFFILSFAFTLCCGALFSIEYEIALQGEMPQDIKQQLHSSSELIGQQNIPPTTLAGLKHRVDADTETFQKILQSKGYYNAKIDFQFVYEKPVSVIAKINTGPVYPISSFTIIADGDDRTFLYNTIPVEDLGITSGDPALPKKILEAEEKLLEIMKSRGYPLATITNREVVANQENHTISVTLHVDSGSKTAFGETSISGLSEVNEEFLTKKIAWKQGEMFDPNLIEQSQTSLEASGLFRSIQIVPDETMTANNQLPIRIEVEEAKHRSIGVGVAYNTQRGPGATAEWEHRNIRGMGEKLSFDIDLWGDLQELSLVYTQPDYHLRQRDLLWLMDFRHETTRGFREYSFSIARMIEHQVNEQIRASYGLMYKRLLDTHADGDGLYNLIKTPLHIRWSNANSILDPTEGCTVHFKAIPTLHIPDRPFAYIINTLNTSFYKSLTSDQRYVLASKILCGSIWGSSRRIIPASERFYEGTECTLRGYRFLSVSPLNDDNKPIGGRSMLIFSEELRVRATECFGWVLFYDIGNVYADPIPNVDRKVLQSVGYGLRYHTPVGPLRLDFAVPLNRREDLDPRFQIYLSIGQAF